MAVPTYLLDTCVCIRLLRGGGAPVARRLAAAAPGAIAMSAISHAELVDGAARGRVGALAALDVLLDQVPVIAFDEAAARAFPTAR
ncbi:PIN domain-containing protein, partial [Sphingomonas sp. WG]|uniref:PIN domain-containing protein n=3 Tax=Sphingomonas TaxID=13687 RepID=UPI0007368FAC